MNPAKFEKLVFDTLDALPPALSRRINNVAIVVQPLPDHSTMQQAGVDDPFELLGFYQGIPLTERTSDYGLVLPDVIYIFQKPIQAICSDETEIRAQVRKTVLHELAHYFGIEEDGLEGTPVE